MINKAYVSLALAALLISGCSDNKEEQSKPQAATQKAATEAAPAAEKENIHGIYGVTGEAMTAQAESQQKAPVEQSGRVGVILETMNAAGYTYAKVEEKGEQFWIAGPETPVKKGDTVSYVEEMWMENFPSKALNKTFDKLMFVKTIVPSGAAAAEAVHDCENCGPTKDAADAAAAAVAAGASGKVDAAAHMAGMPLPVGDVKVEKLEGGVTVAEIFEKKDALNTKTVKLRAKVTKVSRSIMGKDWVHIQDGTGAQGSNDLTVTTPEATVAVGDVVTVEGVVQTNIDFGYGYSYAVLMQEAKFTK